MTLPSALIAEVVAGYSPWKFAVDVVATTNITLSGTQTVDGVALQVGDKVLPAGQTNAALRVPHVVAAGAWTKAVDFNASARIPFGAMVRVLRGTANQGLWYLSSPTTGTITLGSTALTWTKQAGADSTFGEAIAYDAGTGELTLSNNGDDRLVVTEYGVEITGSLTVDGHPLPVEPDGRTAICCMGDSFTQGPASDTIAAYREALFVLLRQERSAFKFVGSQASGFTMASFGTSDRTILGDWHHEGHTGQTIANMASYTAAMAASDIILLIIGTNDALAGQTGAQMLTSMAALLVTMAANVSDSCVVLVSKISYLYAPVASPSTKNTHIDTYNAGLAALAAEHGPNFRVVEVASELDAGSEFSSDGIHYNAAGAVKIATLWNTEIQRVVLARGLGCPRRLVLRPGGSSVDLAQGATDKIVIPYGTGLKPPGAGSFTAAIWFRPHVGLITGDHVLMQYGTAHADGYLVAQNGRTIKVYLKGVLLHTSFACLASEKWHRIVAVCDATNLELRLYVTREGVESDPTRGHLVYTGAISAWDVSVNEATTIGFTAATAGVSGLVDGFVFCAGAAADIGDVEADYYDGQALPGATASYLLAEGSSTSVDDATALGGPTGTITTSATSTYVWSPQPSSRIPRYRKPFDEPDAVVQSVIEALQEASAWSLCLLSYQGVQLIRGEWSATGQAAEVETWLDGSDFRNHFTSYGATPVLFDPTAFGGAGGLVFDGVSATLGIFGGGARQVDFTDLQIAGGTAFTGFFVFEAHGSATNSANAYANAGILVNDNGQLSFAIRSGNVIIGAKDGGFQSVSAAFRVGKPTVVACRLDGGLLYVQVDDDAESAGVACGALTSIAASPCWIGRSNGVEYFEGVIGAVLLAPTVLTPDQRTHVRTELKERFLRRRVAHLVADKSGNVLVPNSTAVPGTPLAAGYLYASTGDGTWKSDTPTVTTFGP